MSSFNHFNINKLVKHTHIFVAWKVSWYRFLPMRARQAFRPTWPVRILTIVLKFLLSNLSNCFVKFSSGLMRNFFVWLLLVIYIYVFNHFMGICPLSQISLLTRTLFSSNGRKGSGPAAIVLAPNFARFSAISLPAIFAWDGTHKRLMGLLLDMYSKISTQTKTSFDVSLVALTALMAAVLSVQIQIGVVLTVSYDISIAQFKIAVTSAWSMLAESPV